MKRLIAGGFAAAGLLLAACSSEPAPPQPSPSQSTLAPATAQPTPNGLRKADAAQIYRATVTASREASSFRVTGSFPVPDAGLDMVFTESGAMGTITRDGEQVQIVGTPQTVYVQGGTEYAAQLAGGQVPAGKWLAVPATDERAAELFALTDGPAFLDQVVLATDTMVEGRTRKIDGQPAIELKYETGNLWVALLGQPYPILMDSGSEGGSLTFSEWNAPQDIEIPPADDVVQMPGSSATG